MYESQHLEKDPATLPIRSEKALEVHDLFTVEEILHRVFKYDLRKGSVAARVDGSSGSVIALSNAKN